MKDGEYSQLKYDMGEVLNRSLSRFLNDIGDNDEHLNKLKEYVASAMKDGCNWNIDKAQAVLDILKVRNEDKVNEICAYLEHSECGWQQDGMYASYNDCRNMGQRCRRNSGIDNNPVMVGRAFADIDQIFLHEEYGAIVTYLFGYCLAALFSSRLKREKLSVPYFLQIACERNSNVYRLIHEVVDICDVNVGLLVNCYPDFRYGYCNRGHITVYPSKSAGEMLDDLLLYRDIPIVVDGYESPRLYRSLLQESANIPGRIKRLGMQYRFNTLPIFICSTIKSEFSTIFSMDLTTMDIDDDYMELIAENKQMLASWAYELVTDPESYFKLKNSTVDRIWHTPKGERPTFDKISNHITSLRTRYRPYSGLNVHDMTNIGYLTYFFSRYMRVFRRAIRLTEGTEFIYRSRYAKHNPEELTQGIVMAATDSLVKFHNNYSPSLPVTISIGGDNLDPIKLKNARKKGEQYARGIIKSYESYGVLIDILPRVEYKDGRYVFSVKLRPGTNERMIRVHADEVRRLLGVEFFWPNVSPSSIDLIVSDSPLKECSLLSMLESHEFRNSKLDIPYAVGYDIMGKIVISDVSKFPHLLIGGTSGSGKSSAIHSLLMSIVSKQPADKVKLMLFDLGSSRLNMFANVPHMLIQGKVVRSVAEGQQYIHKLQGVMERRLKELDSVSARDYDTLLEKWPSIVCVIDEFSAFTQHTTGGKGSKEVCAVITDLLSRARKVKIHLVLSAQDATQNSIGIKNTNLAAGIAFSCENAHDSIAIIGVSDAKKLSGTGSMYFKCNQYDGLRRLQGAYMPPEEIIDALAKMEFTTSGAYESVTLEFSSPDILSYDPEPGTTTLNPKDEDEELLIQIVRLALDRGKISNKLIKDNLHIGYDRAKKYIDRLEAEGIVPAKQGESKLARPINSDKAREFLQRHEYVYPNASTPPDQGPDVTGIQDHTEAVLETDGIEATTKPQDIQERIYDPAKAKRISEELGALVKKKSIKSMSQRRKTRNKSKH